MHGTRVCGPGHVPASCLQGTPGADSAPQPSQSLPGNSSLFLCSELSVHETVIQDARPILCCPGRRDGAGPQETGLCGSCVESGVRPPVFESLGAERVKAHNFPWSRVAVSCPTEPAVHATEK